LTQLTTYNFGKSLSYDSLTTSVQFTASLISFGMTMVQEMLRFQTQDFNASLEAYATHRSALEDAQVHYAINRTLHHDDAEYAFPLKRNMTIQAQCEGLLQTRMWTMRTASRKGALSLEALNRLFVDEDDEWAPLNSSRMDNRTRAFVVQALRDFEDTETKFATSALYDHRLLPLDSRFCTPEHDAGTPGPTYTQNSLKSAWSDLMDRDLDEETDVDEVLQLLHFDDAAGHANVGGMLSRCPCMPHDTPALDTKCRIVYEVCTALPDLPVLQAPCAETIPGTNVLYDRRHASTVRAALREQNVRLATCPTFRPSNLWNLSTDLLDLLMHGVSGVTLGNLPHVNDTVAGFLGEPDRELALLQNGGTETLATKFCHGQHNSSDVEAHAFPAVHVIAASPAELACLRYVTDAVWALGVAHAGGSRGAQAAANRSAARWQLRCKAKMRKLAACEALGTFDATLVNSDPVPSTTDELCPFDMPALGTVFFREACLVEYNDKLYDLFCVVPPGEREFKTEQTRDECVVRDARRLLAGNTNYTAAVPELSFAFVEEMLVGPARTLYDLLFPEDRGNASRWFPVGSQLPVHERPADARVTDAVRQAVRGAGADGRIVSVDLPGEELDARTAVLDLQSKVYWKPVPLVAAARHLRTNEPGVRFASVPYWPPAWQFPLGEVLAENATHATGFANYMVAVEGEQLPRTLARALHASETAARYYASTGRCREHNVGMPLQDVNTHRVCTQDTETKEEACSKSAGADLGGGLGPVQGPLFQARRL